MPSDVSSQYARAATAGNGSSEVTAGKAVSAVRGPQGTVARGARGRVGEPGRKALSVLDGRTPVPVCQRAVHFPAARLPWFWERSQSPENPVERKALSMRRVLAAMLSAALTATLI